MHSQSSDPLFEYPTTAYWSKGLLVRKVIGLKGQQSKESQVRKCGQQLNLVVTQLLCKSAKNSTHHERSFYTPKHRSLHRLDSGHYNN